MCQLLGMNSSKPAALGFSFAGFCERGGRTDAHKDGWGIAFHTGSGCQLINEHLASADSPLVAELKRHPVKARSVVAHIRKATQGRVALENSHPFARQLWGVSWSFAHNGDLKEFAPALGHYQPRGDTDSERAFCHLLSGLLARFPDGQPAPAVLHGAVAELAAAIAAHGSFNFILSNGALMLAHCSTQLHYLVRAYPFSVARLIDCELSIDFSKVNHLDDRIAVIATTPLTSNEYWHPFQAGELKLFIDGQPVQPQALAPAGRLGFMIC